MEVRGEENKTKMAAGFSGYSNCARSTTNNGNNSLLTYPQTLDLHHLHLHSRSPSSISTKSKSIRYRECLKNHAATVGGSIYDGCGEFMPSGEEGSLEALKCAACDCHRNFHRKEIDGETQRSTIIVSPIALPPIQHHVPPPPPPPQHHYSSPSSAIVAPVNVAFGGGGGGSGGGTESSSEDLNLYNSVPPPPPFVLSKKRFRTKFSNEQKEKMMDFAEKIGWRMQKQDNELVMRFCNDVGVKRQVFKVWMHNNKSNVAGKKINIQEPGDDHHQQQQEALPL